MQLDYTDYKQNYPTTLAHIDLYYGVGMNASNLSEEGKHRIVARLIEDEGNDLDMGLNENLNSWMAHFMRKPDAVTVEMYRRTLMESIYKNYEKDVVGMFEAIEIERAKERRETKNYVYNKERYHELIRATA